MKHAELTICKSKAFDDWQECANGEEGRPLLHLLCYDSPTTTSYHSVDFAEDISRSLDVARVHCEQESGRPVQEALLERIVGSGDEAARHLGKARLECIRASFLQLVDCDPLEEVGHAHDGFVAERAPECGELESGVDALIEGADV